eukprot:CAMPEP_0184659636 /NCGR_PEP_ID=MMETSP0308-20130426/30414_1 /TAXON_ID=38269 /ORGANISM="Gloeochaete witrockiana, Strain SAG 46.84" /LENGTH=78 /DNA_ID=CAMNT_0027099599 /DNA_START=237 /DNA_END=473 /DNA_ORIENTATION=+
MVVCPNSMADLLKIASEEFRAEIVEIWNKHGDRVTSVTSIENGWTDIFYAATLVDTLDTQGGGDIQAMGMEIPVAAVV